MSAPIYGLGVDPGVETGLVCACLDLAQLNPVQAIVARGTVKMPESGTSDPYHRTTRRARTFVARLEEALRVVSTHDLAFIAVEDPVDARSYWATKGKDKPRESPETRYLQGRMVGLVLAALLRVADVPIVLYPVRGRGRGVHRAHGWMGRRTHEQVAYHARTSARALHDNTWSDHELMALGVLLHHARRLATERGAIP